MIQFVFVNDRVLSSNELLMNILIPINILWPWQGRQRKLGRPSNLIPDGVMVYKVVGPALPDELLIGSLRPLKLSDRE